MLLLAKNAEIMLPLFNLNLEKHLNYYVTIKYLPYLPLSINYSRSQKPTNYDHLGQVIES